MGGAVKSFGKAVGSIADTLTGGVFSPPSVPGSPRAPSREDPAVAEARRKALAAEAEARGRRRTLLTGGRGLTAEPLVARARLLGGV